MESPISADNSVQTEQSNQSARREFLKTAGIAGLGLCASPLLASASPAIIESAANLPAPSKQNLLEFPKGFLWGTATASYQVEGAANADGRGKSIWDTFSHTPGKVVNGDTGDMACDFYNKYKDDIRLMKSLHTKCYRFSIAWSRIFPEGKGAPNQKGVDFYNRLVDELLANGIQPFATMYHWDLPQTLQDRYKGWQSKETSYAFAEYAGFMAEKLSDRVNHFFTLNELWTFIELGYGNGLMAPGLNLPPAELYQARHHAVLAHGLAVQAIKASGKPGTKAGVAENIKVALPYIETPEHIKAAETATREINAGYMTVIMEGKYTDAFLKKAGANAPRFTAEELKIISTPTDFCGINIYNPECYVMASADEQGYKRFPFAASHPTSVSKWLFIAPETIYWGSKYMKDLWGAKEIYITENGCSGADDLSPENQIYDTDRIMFMRNYLTQLQRATAEDIPVKGYFYWSLLDNFEWAAGYSIRFGLYYMDYKSLQRIPKLSADYYSEVARLNAVL